MGARVSEQDQIAATVAVAKLGRNGWSRAHCPFCAATAGADKRWSWGINLESGYWHCFRCGAYGVYKLDGSTFAKRQVVTTLPDVDMPLPSGFVSLTCPERELYPGTGIMMSPASVAINYLHGRGVDVDLAKRLGFGLVPSNVQCCKCCEGASWCRWRSRLIMPVVVAGARVGWVGRSLRKAAKIPYLYPEGMPRGQVLINQDTLFDQRKNTPVLVMEGWLDMLPYLPLVDVVGCLGKPGDDHMRVLARSHRPIVFVLDGDAWRLAATSAKLLAFRRRDVPSAYFQLPPCQDPNDEARAGRRERLIRHAWRTVGHVWNQLDHAATA